MSQTSDAILMNRRDGLAMRLHGLFYDACADSGQQAINIIIDLQDRALGLERKEAQEIHGKIMADLENVGTTVTLPLSAIEDETYVITGLDQKRYRIVRDDRTVIKTEAIQSGMEIATLQSRYVLVPPAYDDIEVDGHGTLSIGSGPEQCSANVTDNPAWLWNHAGNAAALAAELDKRQKAAAFDG